MPYDISYKNIPGGSLLETQYGTGNAAGGGGGFGGSMQGSLPGMPDMTEFYQAMAAKQAEAENYRRQQKADELARQQEMVHYDRRKAEQSAKYSHEQDRQKEIQRNNMMEAMKKQQMSALGNSGPDQDVHLGEADQYMGFKGFGHLGAGDRGPIALQYKRDPRGGVY